jgi:hypothetical protein
MTFLLIIGFGISYSLKHPKMFQPPQRRQLDSSPDDTGGNAVADVKSKLTKDAMSTLGGSGFNSDKMGAMLGDGGGAPSFTPAASPSYNPSTPIQSNFNGSDATYSAVPVTKMGGGGGGGGQVRSGQITNLASSDSIAAILAGRY